MRRRDGRRQKAPDPCRRERTRVVAGAGKVDSRAVGLHGIRRTAELNEATTELAECGGRSRIGAVDGSLTEGGSCVGIVARLEQRIAQAQIGLERRGIGSILRSSRERLSGRRVVAHGASALPRLVSSAPRLP